MPSAPSLQAWANISGPSAAMCSLNRITLEQIEGVEHGDITAAPAAQRLKIREPVRPDHDRLAVEREALSFQPSRAFCDRRQPRRPIEGLAAQKPNELAV